MHFQECSGTLEERGESSLGAGENREPRSPNHTNRGSHTYIYKYIIIQKSFRTRQLGMLRSLKVQFRHLILVASPELRQFCRSILDQNLHRHRPITCKRVVTGASHLSYHMDKVNLLENKFDPIYCIEKYSTVYICNTRIHEQSIVHIVLLHNFVHFIIY